MAKAFRRMVEKADRSFMAKAWCTMVEKACRTVVETLDGEEVS
jgi:hypothetical protein